MNKAVFFDKDGTLIDDIPYNVNPALIRLQDGVAEGLRQLKLRGYLLIVISNQSGVARGYFGEEELDSVKGKLAADLAMSGVELDAFFYCPHHPRGTVVKYALDCDCRKPRPGMILAAADQFDIDLHSSWMVGDILDDVEAGNTAGCKTILLKNGGETEWLLTAGRCPTAVATDIKEAVSIILNDESDVRTDEAHNYNPSLQK